MKSDYNYSLWDNREEHFYRDRFIEPFTQSGLTCVSTALGSLAGKGPGHFLTSIRLESFTPKIQFPGPKH